MKRLRLFVAPLLCALLLAGAAFAADIDPGRLCSAVCQLLEDGHFSHRKIDDQLSRQLFKNYIDELDYDHLFFTQKDIAALESAYAASLGRDVMAGETGAVVKMFDTYRERVEARVKNVRELVKQPFDFKSDRFVEITREKSAWPKDDADADRIWHDQIEADLLDEKLNENATDPAPKVVLRRYEEILTDAREASRSDVLDRFLFVLAQTFDPHSEYLTKDALEELESDMRLSTVGIGVVLQSEGGYVKVTDVMNGSPAQRDGRLKVGDRIGAVAQGQGKFVNIVGMKLDKALDLIRGKKGTVVRLQVVPAHSPDPSARKVVEITRDDIQFKDEEARAELVDRDGGGGHRERIGWITLPSFYEDMDSARGRSATRDVRTLLARLKAEKITGLVVDLRQNGGGALEEAVNLTGLFVSKSPVVQEKDSDGKIYISRTRDSVPFYDGPLVVLTDHLTASASEIFASAIQDLGRGVVVGSERTYGKGTVQTVIDMKDVLGKRKAQGAGAVQLTIAKFYRVAGGSTQLRGMTPDIKLPSPSDLPVEGEAAMKNPLPYDEIHPVAFKKFSTNGLFLSELRERSAARLADDSEFTWINEDLARERERRAANRISLNEETRRAELAEEKAREATRREARAKSRQPSEDIFTLTLENVRKPALEPAKRKTHNAKKGAAADTAVDAVRQEALSIVSDLGALSRAQKPMQASRDDAPHAGSSHRAEPVAATVR
jgi:carboxyl-terminal processing protease